MKYIRIEKTDEALSLKYELPEDVGDLSDMVEQLVEILNNNQEYTMLLCGILYATVNSLDDMIIDELNRGWLENTNLN